MGFGLIVPIPMAALIYFISNALIAIERNAPMSYFIFGGALVSSVVAGFILSIFFYILAPLENLDTTGERELSTVIASLSFVLVYVITLITSLILMQSRLIKSQQ